MGSTSKEGQKKAVLAAKITIDLVDVYIIDEKAFYYYNFIIISQSEHIDIPLIKIFHFPQISTA